MGSCCSVRIRADHSPRRDGLSSRYVSFDGRDTSSRRSSSSSVPLTPRNEGEILESTNLKTFGFNDLRIATRNFRPDSVLGEGGFGCVFKGWIDENTFKAAKPGTGTVIAVKRLNQEGFQGHKEWLTEINYLGQLYHPNLVKLIGYCLEDEHRLLVYEFMPRGSLENHLFRRTSYFQPLSWKLRMKVALGAAKGLAYLHSPNAKVIYRDFKSSNILLDSNYNAKLSDFGLAKDGPMDGKSHVSTRVMGTYGYAAPEYMATGHLTARSGVYSFGRPPRDADGPTCIGQKPSSREQNLIEWARPYLASKRRVLRHGCPYRRPILAKWSVEAATIAVKCLAVEPKYRPTMNEVVKALEQLQDTDIVKAEEAQKHRRTCARF
ncbi:hypothetical protein DH2020_022176 [Rehmannia glutinosa]|uniref:Protein kinase domain-containing protein n=1 Tax=Rehmannia glutinosa TaxID=99300 RepID=A0ABR0WCM2_REHGL